MNVTEIAIAMTTIEEGSMIASTTDTTATMIASTMIVIMSSTGTAIDTEKDLPGTWITKEKSDAAVVNGVANGDAIDLGKGLVIVVVQVGVVMTTEEEIEIVAQWMTTTGSVTASVVVAVVASVLGRKRAKSEKVNSCCPKLSLSITRNASASLGVRYANCKVVKGT